MGHFEREVKINLWFLALIVGLPLAIGLCGVLAYPMVESARIDACLDQGGSWDYEAHTCDHERSHPVP